MKYMVIAALLVLGGTWVARGQAADSSRGYRFTDVVRLPATGVKNRKFSRYLTSNSSHCTSLIAYPPKSSS